MLFQIADIGISSQHPQQFNNDGFEVQLFSGQRRKTIIKIETHLVTENRFGSSAGAVRFLRTMFHNVFQKVDILLHDERKISNPSMTASWIAIRKSKGDSIFYKNHSLPRAFGYFKIA